jgi:hypothetical protein
MPKEDYLLKYLEKLARVIAAMLGFRDKGYPEESLRVADETFKELLNFNIEELAIMPVEKFIDTIRNEKYNSSYLEGLSQLTNETAKTYTALGKMELANSFYVKALQMYYLLNEKNKTFSFEREGTISDLLELTKKR